jgi:hypothetical protein
MSKYTEWRNQLWKLSNKEIKGLNKRQDRVRHRLAFKVKRAVMDSFSDYKNKNTNGG